MGIFALRKPRKTSPDRRSQVNATRGYAGHAEDGGMTLVPEDMFRKVLSLERKRSERSRQRFVLMLVHTGKLLQAERREAILGAITKALSVSTRETDLWGWYKKDMVVGVICTEIGSADMTSILSALHSRVSAALRSNLDLEQMNVIHISFHVFPDDLDLQNGGRPADTRLYPDLQATGRCSKSLSADQESDRYCRECIRFDPAFSPAHRDCCRDQADIERANPLQTGKTGTVRGSVYVLEVQIDVFPE